MRVLHMIDAAESAGQFMAGRQRVDLDRDRMLLFAVVRAIEVIGEAASRVPGGEPGHPMERIVGTRNRLIHGYFDIDTEIVWKTVTRELADLLPRLRTLIRTA